MGFEKIHPKNAILKGKAGWNMVALFRKSSKNAQI
jgi:hypothetical protein